jgi:hypothetical protein
LRAIDDAAGKPFFVLSEVLVSPEIDDKTGRLAQKGDSLESSAFGF